ncbi:bifunctional non-homologous end joining protein LigD [Verrucomicrobium sp. GAS474]|uniref:non-homologous end-joining DNA ligase n=1 Tax=Verrucomicrobium sp. GAS474 TaxID=1882831 RepID=UPI00087B67D6|nr:non-homologous end-joining DNA ligase [Verrucomicrobium sp. GAS474]SDU12147.1 bifunctional non-homologous end joining protein LigD [Verrucomicrobium sp. GAS474]
MKKLSFVVPMKASTSEPPSPADCRWLYEMKFDGYRGIAIKNGKQVELLSRNRNSLDVRFPEVVTAIAKLPVDRCVIDGEICALDPKGRTSFQLIQNAEEGTVPIVYYAFDLLFEGSNDLRTLPLVERKERLDALLVDAHDPVRPSVYFDRDVAKTLTRMRKIGAEGAIAKVRDSAYVAGSRSADWVKIRFSLQQEFVIGGYSEPKGSRSGFGALLLGYYDKDRRLIYASKVGTGFNDKTLASTFRLLQVRVRKKSPFAPFELKRTRWTRGPLSKVHWVKPDLVAQISFTEWTDDGSIRHPVFLGLRDDKPSMQVVREPVARAK